MKKTYNPVNQDLDKSIEQAKAWMRFGMPSGVRASEPEPKLLAGTLEGSEMLNARDDDSIKKMFEI